MAEKTGYTYYADPQQVDFTLRMTVPALANEVLNTAGVDAQRHLVNQIAVLHAQGSGSIS